MTTRGTVKVLRQYFYLDSVYEGAIDYHRNEMDVYENVGLSEAAAIIEFEGLKFSATGDNWAADPDGSYSVNHRDGEECETSAFLSGFSTRAVTAIMRKVG